MRGTDGGEGETPSRAANEQTDTPPIAEGTNRRSGGWRTGQMQPNRSKWNRHQTTVAGPCVSELLRTAPCLPKRFLIFPQFAAGIT